jgi:Zn-dependent protease with chaperone function
LTKIRAEYADGQTPVMHAVLVQLQLDALRIESATSGELVARWPLARTTLDELQEGGVGHAQCVDQPLAQLTITDAELLVALRARVARGTRLPGLGGRGRYVLACLAAIVALSGGIYWAIPTISQWIAQRVPLEYERELGAQLLPLISRDYCEQTQADAALQALKRRLDPRGEIPAEVHVWRSDIVNAFALPGGIVVISEELLKESSSPDEVAGVLAHELEHVRQRHVLTHFVRATLLAAGWSVAVGDYAGLMVIDPTTAFNLVNLRFSRDEEAAADAAAAITLDRARVSRRGLYDFFQRLRAETDGVPAWLSNHPTSESRARLLGTGDPSELGANPALTDEEFAALQGACRE